jgi:hypothetical protein
LATVRRWLVKPKWTTPESVILCFAVRRTENPDLFRCGSVVTMSIPTNTPEKVRDYFRGKAKQLAALAALPVCDHPGLTGSHREQIQRIYLREILPKRFEVGRGMVYGKEHRSHEADIVVWDADHYPSLPLSEHALYFAESVRIVVESKSRWSAEECRDVLKKTQAIRGLHRAADLSLADDVSMIWSHIERIEHGSSGGDVPVIIRPPIGTACLFLEGGSNASMAQEAKNLGDSLDECWPDILLALETGTLAVKNYDIPGLPKKTGRLDVSDLGDDALFAFTCAMLSLLADRAVQVEGLIDLWTYFPMPITPPTFTLDFSVTLPTPRRSHQPKGLFHFEP